MGVVAWDKVLTETCALTRTGVTFDFNQATLRPESMPSLERAAAVLGALPGQSFEVQGHTDSVGEDKYNLGLSTHRADAVRSWLVDHGVAAGQLTSRGYGETVAIAPNDTDIGRARNRRVELTCRK